LLVCGQPSISLLWSKDVDGDIQRISISSDGSYLVVGTANEVFFFDKSGKLLWSREIKESLAELSISSDGNYVVVTSKRQIGVSSSTSKAYLFDKSGNLLWSHEIEGAAIKALISSDGAYIVLASDTGLYSDKLYCFDKSGDLLWDYDMGELNKDSVSISLNGNYIAVASEYPSGSLWTVGKVDLLDNSGKILWSREVGESINSASISSDGNYIAVGSGEVLHFFYRPGMSLWTKKLEDSIYGMSLCSNR